MPTAEIKFPNGQNVKEGERVELNFRYTGQPPNPDDVHLYVKPLGDSDYPSSPSGGWDINPAAAGNPGATFHWPAGTAGTYDFLVEWTWKTGDKRREKGGEGQYFVKKKPAESGWCLMFIAILMGIGGWVGGFAFGPSLIGYVIGLAIGFGLGVLVCVIWHWAQR
jgi:hypothetical protein